MKRAIGLFLALLFPIGALVAQTVTSVPPAGVTSITAGNGLSGGTISAGSGTFSLNLDFFSATQGRMLYRGPSGWAATPMPAGPAQGRLTLTTGTPVLSSTVAAAGTVYFTPYSGNFVPVSDGVNFVWRQFSELSNILANGATGNAGPVSVSASKVYDLFVWDSGGTLFLTRGPAWDAGTAGSNTVRGTGAGSTELQFVNGLLTNKIAITNGPAANRGTYVGTIATDSSGATVTWQFGSLAAGGGPAILNVWNMWNRIPVETMPRDSTASWTYNSGTTRAAGGANGVRSTFVVGLNEEPASAFYDVPISSAAAGFAYIGVCLDSTSAFSGLVGMGPTSSVTGAARGGYGGSLLGAHFIQACESMNSGNVHTFYGTGTLGGGASLQSGMIFRGRF